MVDKVRTRSTSASCKTKNKYRKWAILKRQFVSNNSKTLVTTFGLSFSDIPAVLWTIVGFEGGAGEITFSTCGRST
jgi:hypothetical protein